MAWTLKVADADPAGIVMAAGTKILLGVLCSVSASRGLVRRARCRVTVADT